MKLNFNKYYSSKSDQTNDETDSTNVKQSKFENMPSLYNLIHQSGLAATNYTQFDNQNNMAKSFSSNFLRAFGVLFVIFGFIQITLQLLLIYYNGSISFIGFGIFAGVYSLFLSIIYFVLENKKSYKFHIISMIFTIIGQFIFLLAFVVIQGVALGQYDYSKKCYLYSSKPPCFNYDIKMFSLNICVIVVGICMIVLASFHTIASSLYLDKRSKNQQTNDIELRTKRHIYANQA